MDLGAAVRSSGSYGATAGGVHRRPSAPCSAWRSQRRSSGGFSTLACPPLDPSVITLRCRVSMADARSSTAVVARSGVEDVPDLELTSLTALSPLDGRYQQKVKELRPYFSEYGLIRYRVMVEVKWLLKLSEIPEITEVLEYFHFACTSEDMNNLAYALALKEGLNNVLFPNMVELCKAIYNMAKENASVPMLSRTHGQTASPTTLGKEMLIFAHRLIEQVKEFPKMKILGKFAGAVGNYNAHMAAYPDINWATIAEEFVRSLGITFNPYVTQVVKAGEIGSSTMPHKVNPIDFENSEGNLSIANALLAGISGKIIMSRMQRDLTDSTVLRNLGGALGYSLVAYKSALQGIHKLQVNEARLSEDLEQSWEVLAEAIQTVMRRYGIPEPYEKLKELTRGHAVTKESIRNFVACLELPDEAKSRLSKMTPHAYIGAAADLVRSAELDVNPLDGFKIL